MGLGVSENAVASRSFTPAGRLDFLLAAVRPAVIAPRSRDKIIPVAFRCTDAPATGVQFPHRHFRPAIAYLVYYLVRGVRNARLGGARERIPDAV